MFQATNVVVTRTLDEYELDLSEVITITHNGTELECNDDDWHDLFTLLTGAPLNKWLEWDQKLHHRREEPGWMGFDF